MKRQRWEVREVRQVRRSRRSMMNALQNARWNGALGLQTVKHLRRLPFGECANVYAPPPPLEALEDVMDPTRCHRLHGSHGPRRPVLVVLAMNWPWGSKPSLKIISILPLRTYVQISISNYAYSILFVFYAYLPMHMCVHSRLNSRQCSHPVSFDVFMLLRVQLKKNLSSQGAKCAKHDWDFWNAKVVCKSMVHAEAMGLFMSLLFRRCPDQLNLAISHPASHCRHGWKLQMEHQNRVEFPKVRKQAKTLHTARNCTLNSDHFDCLCQSWSYPDQVCICIIFGISRQ